MGSISNKIIALVALAVLVGGAAWYMQQRAATEPAVDTAPATVENKQESKPAPDVVLAAPDSGNKDGNCLADSDWFPQSQTQRTDDAAFKSTSNCVFHKWSWQNFLWLTQDVNGQPRFLDFATPQSLLGTEQAGLMPRMAKGDTAESFDEYLQAGTDGIMVAHNGRAVYYSQYLDSTFVDFVQGNNLTDPAALRALIDSNPATEFPVTGTAGAMELKASWMIVEEGDDVSDMFTMQTEVAKLVNKDGQIVIDPDPDHSQSVTVALVGFHIGGIVDGHPEMIWATFEHVRNSPSVAPGTTLEQPVSEQDFTFYTAGTKLADCNVNYTSSNQLVLDEATQTLSPVTQACLQYEFGNVAGVGATNDGNVKMLNDSVWQGMQDGNIWKNYREIGAIWFNQLNALQPGMSLADDSILTGSLALSNSTIETFTQVASTEHNCFRCHNTLQQLPSSKNLQPLPASNLNISHALQNIYFWSQEDNQ